jgi:phenylacetate-CoA oxygenase PaaJ subunit
MVMAVDTPPIAVEQVWAWLAEVPDPEIPVVSVVDLGIVRDVAIDDSGECVVTITPTYSGCPAMQVIAEDVEAALHAKGVARVRIATRLSPAWTTDCLARLRHRTASAAGDRHQRAVEKSRCKPQRYFPASCDQAAAGRLPALRFQPHPPHQPVRLDPVQGAVPVPRLPRALRLLQVPLSL